MANAPLSWRADAEEEFRRKVEGMSEDGTGAWTSDVRDTSMAEEIAFEEDDGRSRTPS